MDGVLVGEAELGDIPRLAALLGELFAQEHDFSPNVGKQERGLRLILDQPERGRIFVARHGDEVIAMANALITISTAEGGPVILLEDVIVAGTWRGRGVGGFLIGHVTCWARCNGFLRVTLLADENNTAALRFYGRNGFVHSNMAVLRRGLQAEGEEWTRRPTEAGSGRAR